ncbi:unnamed protein product, partial [Mesorhabditis belari]|uniref:Protein kinase domain-containing protein n=1 Tax=Mesorhabditis belari TaxID=2138241 RepID=A0AAF3ETP4_9BILA
MATCSVNLFISKEETSRTLGMTAELSYLEDGVINQYSTRFPYRVDQNVTQLKFSWNSLLSANYSMRVQSEDFALLALLRVPSVGQVPRQTEEFAVEYRCAGMKAGQFEVSLYIDFALDNGKNIRLHLKQEKICATRDGRRFIIDDSDTNRTDEENGNTELSLLRHRSTPSRSRLPESFKSFRNHTPSQQPFLTSTPNKSWSTLSTKLRPSTSASKPGSSAGGVKKTLPAVDVKSALISLHADRNLFTILAFDELQGTFGEVKWAIWRQTASGFAGDVDEDEDDGTGDEAMLVKTLKPSANQQQLERFLSDALVFHHVPAHTNIAKVAAAASYGRFDRPETVTDLPMICYRHQGFGNLKKFLLSCRTDGASVNRKDKSPTSGIGQTLRTHELVWMGVQIGRALNHLHTFGIVHKDVATRNCIVAELKNSRSADRLHVQLTDTALAKDLFPGDYNCLGDNENRPVAWMAPESFESNNFTESTDVWSYGVTLWELLNCGSQPFVGVDPEDIQRAILQGARPAQPLNCPDQLYVIMRNCWTNATDRPKVSAITQMLQEFTNELTQYV